MELFETVFNNVKIYEMLFFNVKSVLEYPSLDLLKSNDEPMYERWRYLAETKHGLKPINSPISAEDIYLENAPNYPEFSRIVAITYASLYIDGTDIKRDFKKIVNQDESVVIEAFMSALRILSSEGAQSNPPFFPILCGHNIIGHDIPLLIKRYIKLTASEKVDNMTIPLILKNCLNAKPWDSKFIDTSTVWKFNGYKVAPLMTICDFVGLKKTVDLKSNAQLSEDFWNKVADNQTKAIEEVALQSATQTNLVIQLMNLLRKY